MWHTQDYEEEYLPAKVRKISNLGRYSESFDYKRNPYEVTKAYFNHEEFQNT